MPVSIVSVKLLKPHPKNKEYYSDLGPVKYEELKRGIAVHGIRDPMKVLPDFTIVAGHQRHKIVLELGIEKVPVKMEDLTENETEYLLIADNEERRQADDDPVRKAKRAKFLEEYWKIKRGGDRKSKGKIYPLKTLDDVAELVGESRENLKKLIKLNDLIPEIQALVSSGKLGTTAAYELAFLSPGTQNALNNYYGQQLAEIKLSEAKQLRRKIEAELEAQKDSQVLQLQEKVKELERKNQELRCVLTHSNIQKRFQCRLKSSIICISWATKVHNGTLTADSLYSVIPEGKTFELHIAALKSFSVWGFYGSFGFSSL